MTNDAAIHLLIIDPQNDFCDVPAAAVPPAPATPGASLHPALPVPGGHQDMLRLADFMRRASGKFSDVHVTLDSHHPLHIAHPLWWVDPEGRSPAPFTVIRAGDVQMGKWRSRNLLWQERSRAYVDALDAGGRYTLVIWPEHCLVGHWGHNVHPAVAQQLARWEREKLETVDYIFKGSNPFTEHYSAVQAEVPDAADPGTLLNTRLIEALAAADMVVVAGEALSHCVANTVRDIARNIGTAKIARLTLLTDCTSPVGGFERLGEDFLREMTARGMRTARSVDLQLKDRRP
jgi:nicotinamidase-related amidase